MPARLLSLLCTAALAASLAVLPAVVRADGCACDGPAQDCSAQCTTAQGSCTASLDGDYASCVLAPGCGGAADPACQAACTAEMQSHAQTCDDNFSLCAGQCQALADACAAECAVP